MKREATTLRHPNHLRMANNPTEQEAMKMTQLLERAIEAARKLSASEQDAIAALILEELADERRWEEAFAGSQDRLAELAAKVRRDIAEGRVHDIGIGEL